MKSHEKEQVMKVLVKWVLLGLLLAAFVAVATPVATAQSPVTLTVYDPTGAFEVTQTFAPRATDLNGKTICEVSDGMWEGDRTFPLIGQLLQKQFPTAKVISYDKFPVLQLATDVPGLEDAVKKAGCQAVVVGNAG
jgi:hypothetical protein